MTDLPRYNVEDISSTGDIQAIAEPTVQLDERDKHGAAPPPVSARANALIAHNRATAKAVYRITWHGSRVPYGAVVGGYRIMNTQREEVIGTGGRRIGTYVRIVDNPTTGPQQIIVFLR